MPTALGSQTLQIESVEPFYLDPKLPLEVTMDDVIRAPIGIVNATNASLGGTAISITGQAAQKFESAIPPFALQPNERARRMMRVRVGKFNGRAEVTLSANAGPYRDEVTRSVMVKPLGFPIEDGAGGLLRPGDAVSHEFAIPADLVPRSLAARMVVYPTPLASLTITGRSSDQFGVEHGTVAAESSLCQLSHRVPPVPPRGGSRGRGPRISHAGNRGSVARPPLGTLTDPPTPPRVGAPAGGRSR